MTHVIVTSCTGLYAPGLDFEIVDHLGLNPSVERTMIGFMGCYAAINALKSAHHIVRSEPDAVVLILNLELCTLHLQETQDLEQMLSFLLFADGCAACLVSAEPRGLGDRQLSARCRFPETEPPDHVAHPRARVRHASLRPGPGEIAQRHEGSGHADYAWRGSARDRPVGGASRRPHHSGCGGERAGIARRMRCGYSRVHPGALRQHVVGDGDVCLGAVMRHAQRGSRDARCRSGRA